MQAKIEIFDKNNLSDLKWAHYDEGAAFQQFFEPLISQGTKPYISNLNVDMALLAIGHSLVPIAFGKQSEAHQAYVASNIGQYLNYQINELGKLDVLKGAQKWATIASLKVLKAISKSGSFDHCIFVNSFLLSSNLWGDTNSLDIKSIIAFLTREYPDRAIIFKGVTKTFHQSMYESLKKEKCLPVFARELYFLDPKNSKYKKKRPFVIDRKHAEKLEGEVDWHFPDALSETEVEEFIGFYKSLYIDKYSDYNPDCTNDFLQLISKSDFFKIGSIKDSKELLGAQVVFERGKIMTTPFIGYNRDKPKEKGLYRLLNYYLTKESVSNDCILNMSSGAGKFKKQRGGKAVLEYNMVYDLHLNAVRKLPWRLFKYIGQKVVIPNLSKLNI